MCQNRKKGKSLSGSLMSIKALISLQRILILLVSWRESWLIIRPWGSIPFFHSYSISCHCFPMFHGSTEVCWKNWPSEHDRPCPERLEEDPYIFVTPPCAPHAVAHIWIHWKRDPSKQPSNQGFQAMFGPLRKGPGIHPKRDWSAFAMVLSGLNNLKRDTNMRRTTVWVTLFLPFKKGAHNMETSDGTYWEHSKYIQAKPTELLTRCHWSVDPCDWVGFQSRIHLKACVL